MRPKPFAELADVELAELRLLASDIDDTLTRDGKMLPEVVTILSKLHESGLLIWLVTGRCAAWGQALARYLEVDGVIAENGGVIIRAEKTEVVADRSLIGPGREKLAALFAEIRRRLPAARETDDNIGRLTDWAFDAAPLSREEGEAAAALAAAAGFRCLASSIHVHLFAGNHDKAATLARICAEAEVHDHQQVMTMGDSANDESLFDTSRFPLSAAVSNIEPYLDRLAHRPAYLLPEPGAEGALICLRRLLTVRLRKV